MEVVTLDGGAWTLSLEEVGRIGLFRTALEMDPGATSLPLTYEFATRPIVEDLLHVLRHQGARPFVPPDKPLRSPDFRHVVKNDPALADWFNGLWQRDQGASVMRLVELAHYLDYPVAQTLGLARIALSQPSPEQVEELVARAKGHAARAE